MTKPSVLALIAEQSNYIAPVYKALSYERVTANLSTTADGRIIRFRPRFDTSNNQYLAIGDSIATSGYMSRWVKLDSTGSLSWSRYNTLGQGAIEKPWSVVSVFPDSTNTYYYIMAISNLQNAQGYSYPIIAKFNMSTHARIWQFRYGALLKGSTGGRQAPFAVYDASDNSIYFVSDVQSGTTSTSYMGLHKVDGNTGALLMSKTSGNGDATNYGNQNPILALEQFGSYLYLGTYIGNQISVTKFSKTDFSKVWGKVTTGLGTFNTNLSGPAMSVDQNGTVFVAANRATTSQTIIVRVPPDGSSMNYIHVDRPTYAGMVTTATTTNLNLGPESIVVDNDSNIYIVYGTRTITGYTAVDSRCIVGKISWGDVDWRWLKATDIIRQDTGANIGISDGYAIGINQNLLYVNAVCDVTFSGLNVDNNAQWQTLQLKFDKDGKLLTNGGVVGTFAANRRAIKTVNVTPTTITAFTYAGTTSTHFATMTNTGATATAISTTVTAESTDYVNKYN
jgi:hypothetical protein